MCAKRVAVITDTTSSAFYFDLWQRYYGAQFGVENLFVVTSLGSLAEFRSLALGGVWHSTHDYDDRARARTMSAAVTFLLTSYQYVVRVDVDEFLVPDPRRYNGLSDYIEKLERPYVTARGLNIYQAPGVLPIEFERSILVTQRRIARAETALNKTCVTSIPMDWGLGMHFASVYPCLGELFLFHLKRADIEMLVAWGDWMLPQVRGNGELEKYYGQTREDYLNTNKATLNYPLMDGWDALFNAQLDRKFLDSVNYDAANRRYRGPFHSAPHCILVPDEFAGTL